MSPYPAKAILFDLDGTLVDTAPDMALALNRLRLECNRPALPYEQIRPQVSNGARAMIEIGFGVSPGQIGFDILRQRFLQLYAQDIAGRSALFEGLADQVAQLQQHGLLWGVVTNKPGFLSRALMQKLGLENIPLVSGDDLPRRKPWPDPLIYAAGMLRLPPQSIVYVGDHERDVQAGHAAQMDTIAVRWGYLDGERPIDDWGADLVIDSPSQLLESLASRLQEYTA